MNVEWFAAQIATGKPASSGAIPRLNRLAAGILPRADDPLFLPHLGGRVSPSQPHLRGCWAGLCWSHSAAHLYRAVLEGVALEYCISRDVLEALNPELAIREVRVTGGGQRSAVWNRIKADALQIPIVRVTRGEGAPLGAALLAGYGVGLIGDLDDAARQWIRTGDTVQPDPALATHYRLRVDRYRRLLDAMQNWSDPGMEGLP